MKEKTLSELNLEELKNKEKSLKSSSSILIGTIIVLFCAGIFLTIKKGFNVFTVLPVTFLPILLGIFQNLKKIKEEITSRI